MNLEDEILIEDKYGKDRNIVDLLDIDDIENILDDNKKDVLIEKKENLNTKNNQDFQTPIEDKKIYTKSVGDETINTKWRILSFIIATVLISSLSIFIILSQGDIRKTIWGAIRIPGEIIVFLILSIYIVRIKKQIPRTSGLMCASVGLCSGLFIAIYKIIYHRELWTLFNVVFESVFLMLLGLIVGFIFGGLFYLIDKSSKHKYARNK